MRVLQTTTDDNDRRKRPLLVRLPYTMCRQASNKINAAKNIYFNAGRPNMCNKCGKKHLLQYLFYFILHGQMELINVTSCSTVGTWSKIAIDLGIIWLFTMFLCVQKWQIKLANIIIMRHKLSSHLLCHNYQRYQLHTMPQHWLGVYSG